MTASVLAGELHLPLCLILMDKMVTKFMGETSVKLRQVFEIIAEHQAVYLLMSLMQSGRNAVGKTMWVKCDVY